MADLYITLFSVYGEPTDAKFENEESAIALADAVVDAQLCTQAAVVDEFAPRDPPQDAIVYSTAEASDG